MEHIWEVVRPHGTLLSGALFGAGWWVFADALVAAAAAKAPFAFHYCLPGIVATLGVVLLGAAGGEEQDSYYVDEAEACRGKCVLFLSYVIAFGAIFAGATLLMVDRQHDAPLWPAASATIQSTVLSASGLLLWLSRGGGGEDGGGYMPI